MNKSLRLLAVTAMLLGTSACATSMPSAQEVRAGVPVVRGSAPTMNTTPLASAFSCMSQLTNQTPRPLRIAVGQVRDYTGKFSNEASEGGFKITQGGSLMVISALGKINNIDLIERFDTSVADQETALATNKLIRDPGPAGGTVRPLSAGQYDGSDYYIVGGITEVNYNIRSGGAEASVSNIGVGKRIYVMNVAADLRLVDSRTLKVVKTVSMQKQIHGYETKAGVFSFFGDYLVDINAGAKSQEPIQLGVRAVLEMGTLELLSSVVPNADYYRSECRAQGEAGFMG